MPEDKRTGSVSGCVRFPVGSKEWAPTNEGGMFVRLVVDNAGEPFMMCKGGGNSILQDEILVGVDLTHGHFKIPNPVTDSLEELRSEDEYACPFNYHFPSDKVMKDGDFVLALSRDYLCVMTLGSTRWSGYSGKEKKYWTCTYKDLTPRGQAIYGNIQSLYPNGFVTLQTWLDT